MWCAKPWLDRTILFVLSRAAFGQHTAPADVWRAQRQVWWSQLLFTWTVRRLSPWRSFTQPVYQLEGLSIWKRGCARSPDPAAEHGIRADDDAGVHACPKRRLTLALVSLVFWFAPSGRRRTCSKCCPARCRAFCRWPSRSPTRSTVLFLEPFYVAAGFAMYLNRRAELEAWDIEQEFRRAFAH